MPSFTGKSGLSSALQKHNRDETQYGMDFSKLPAGISGGIAQLVEAKMGVYKAGPNQGKPFVYLGGTVMEPEVAIKVEKTFSNGKVVVSPPVEERVRGRQTGLTLPLCETKRGGNVQTEEENVADMLNELRKVGGEECTASVTDEKSLAALLAALKEAKPAFKFSTSGSDPTEQYPTMRVWENWLGNRGLEDWSFQGNGQVQDNTGGAAEPFNEFEGGAPDAAQDPAELAAVADNEKLGDDERQAAIDTLTELALAAGISQEDIDDATSFKVVAKKIAEAGEATGNEDHQAPDEPEPADEAPAKGALYYYKPFDKRLKRKVRKGIECEVTTVNKTEETVTLVSQVDKKTKYEKVPWADLLDEA